MKDQKDKILKSLESLSNEKMDLVLNYIREIGDESKVVDLESFKLRAMKQIRTALKTKTVLV
jgi:hypothetical protein